MKRILVLFILMGLVFVPAVSTSASVNIYVDTMGSSGDYTYINHGDKEVDSDLSLTIAGFEYCAEKWKFGVEAGSGSFDAQPIQQKTIILPRDVSFDYNFYDVKFGYKVIESDFFKLDLTASYAGVDDEFFGKTEGPSLGADLIFILGDKVTAELDLAYAIDPQHKNHGSKWPNDVNMIASKFKLNYMFTENWGASLGYRYRGIDLKGIGHTCYESDVRGATVGINYRF